VPAEYFTKGELPARKKYTVTDIEGLGDVWAVGPRRPYIEESNFPIRCDHNALKWILNTKAYTRNRLNRWRILLSEFVYDLEYEPSREHAVADEKTHLPTEGFDVGPITQEIPAVGVTAPWRVVLDTQSHAHIWVARVRLVELAQKKEDDGFFQEVKLLLDTPEPTRFYQSAYGLLCREDHRAGTQQILVPRSLVEDVFRAQHSSPLAARPVESQMSQTVVVVIPSPTGGRPLSGGGPAQTGAPPEYLQTGL